MAVGIPLPTNYTDGDVWSASNVNDITGTINLLGGGNYAAGKNKIINGDFYVNQRNFTSNTGTGSYGFDRWFQLNSGGTVTVTPQTFTTGAAPVSGYEGKNYLRIVTASQSASGNYAAIVQNIESVRTLAGQNATVSFWAKASTGTPNVGISFEQSFGSGGSPSSTVVTTVAKQTITSSWVRYSFSVNIPSISGKTIGTNNDNSLGLLIFTSCGSGVTGYSTDVGLQNVTIDFWGVQVEAGSTATAFQTATGTIQGELAACQRYYWQYSSNTSWVGMGTYVNSGFFAAVITYPTTMRSNPTLTSTTGTNYYQTVDSGTTDGLNSITIYLSSPDTAYLYNNTDAAGTAYRPAFLMFNNAAAVLAFNSEL